MTTIDIDNNENHVIIDMEFLTPQQFFYTVEVTDKAGNVKFTDNGRWDGKKQFDLGKGASLLDLYLTIYWSVIDPTGAGNQFSAKATAKQNSIIKPEIQVISSKTTATTVNKTTYAHFI